MLQRSAMVHLGLIQAEEGMIHFNLGGARAANNLIDTLDVRTKGNLAGIEDNMLRSIVSELKMQFVSAPARQQDIEAEQKRQEALKQTFTAPKEAAADTLIDDEEE